MFKNMLLASAAAFVVFGSAASLTNMKAVITSGNQAEAALAPASRKFEDQIDAMRVEQVRQATLLSVQETAMRRLQDDLVQARSVSRSVSEGSSQPDQKYTIGLDLPSAERERQAVEYGMAWRQALTLDDELMLAEARYNEMETRAAARHREIETAAENRVAALEAGRAELKQETRFEVSRLEEEIAQRDSSIVGLMHRLVSQQSGNAAAPDFNIPSSPIVPVTTLGMMPMPGNEDTDLARAPDDSAEWHEAIGVDTERRAPTTESTGRTIADGVAAYKARDYEAAYEIWRPLANAGDARAWFHLGALYYEGRGVERQLDTAYVLLSRAADAGHPRAGALRDHIAAQLENGQIAGAAGATPY